MKHQVCHSDQKEKSGHEVLARFIVCRDRYVFTSSIPRPHNSQLRLHRSMLCFTTAAWIWGVEGGVAS